MSVKYCQGSHSSKPDHVIDQIKGPAEVHKIDTGTATYVRRTIMGKPIGILGFDKTYLNEPKQSTKIMYYEHIGDCPPKINMHSGFPEYNETFFMVGPPSQINQAFFETITYPQLEPKRDLGVVLTIFRWKGGAFDSDLVIAGIGNFRPNQASGFTWVDLRGLKHRDVFPSGTFSWHPGQFAEEFGILLNR